MRLGTLLAALCVAFCVYSEVTCITNQEFFDIVKDHVEDLESFDIDDPAINDDDDDDSNVIELPGNADDELDIEYLMTKLDLADVMKIIEERSPMTANKKLGWWHVVWPIARHIIRKITRRRSQSGLRASGHQRRRSNQQTRLQNPCSCRGCCLNHTFKTNLWNKKWRFRVNGDNVKDLLESLETKVENKESDDLFVEPEELKEP